MLLHAKDIPMGLPRSIPFHFCFGDASPYGDVSAQRPRKSGERFLKAILWMHPENNGRIVAPHCEALVFGTLTVK